MGEIARSEWPTRRRVLLIGQAPGADNDTRPLTGAMGVKLAALAEIDARDAGLPEDEWIGLVWDRANVLDFYPGRGPNDKGHLFPRLDAKREAELMMLGERSIWTYDRVLFCGKAVKEVFKEGYAPLYLRREEYRARAKEWRELPPFSWTDVPHRYTRVAWMPHTSMIVPWWNDPENVWRASEFLVELRRWTLIESPVNA